MYACDACGVSLYYLKQFQLVYVSMQHLRQYISTHVYDLESQKKHLKCRFLQKVHVDIVTFFCT